MLTRWDPFQDMITLRNAVDRLLDNTISPLSNTQQSAAWGLALDVIEQDDEFIVKASVPGIKPDDLEITFTDNTLTIKGQTQEDQEIKEANYHLRERRFGSFARSISLSSHINGDKIQANYDSGVLTLTLPKAEEIKPKRIAIKSAKMIEGKVK
jgi:HSP20 family protein